MHKSGLCSYIRSKEDLLLEIQNYGMDIFEKAMREGRIRPALSSPGATRRADALRDARKGIILDI